MRAFALGMPSGTGVPLEQETKYPRPPRTPTRALPSAAFAALDRPKFRALDPRVPPGAVGWRGGGCARPPPWTKALRGEKELRHAAEVERLQGDAKLAAVAEAAATGFRRAAQAAEPAAMQASMAREARRQATAAVAAEARSIVRRSIPRAKLEEAAWGSVKVLR